MQQLLFEETDSLLLGWLLIKQTQYRNIEKGYEEILRQGKSFYNSRKLRKVKEAICKTNKIDLSISYMP